MMTYGECWNWNFTGPVAEAYAKCRRDGGPLTMVTASRSGADADRFFVTLPPADARSYAGELRANGYASVEEIECHQRKEIAEPVARFTI